LLCSKQGSRRARQKRDSLNSQAGSNKPSHADEMHKPRADSEDELAVIGGQVPAKECDPAEDQDGETH
ncbi:hypothetical protein, partial [Mesorhizobium sp. M2E.F.Ca.ET.209.01.1.1]|uniref:hypothetical protein n=1 Tax=Mesorhizobium sp. M2E.F.Ca.ET.209.01.1.1 TaxID=2500526 RepID=UPI001AEDF566